MSEPHPITRALLAVMMQSSEPMVLTAPEREDHPMIAVNAAFEALTGYPAADTLNRNCRFLQGEKTDPQTPSRISKCIAERRGCVEWIVNYRRDGTLFWNLLFISPVFSREGELLHYFGNQRDITAGPPASLPDYSIGKADLPAPFHVMLLDLMDSGPTTGGLEDLVEAARRLDQMTTRPLPAGWSPP